MADFRALPAAERTPLSEAGVCHLARDVLRPCHFFLGLAVQLDWETVEREEDSWEVFRGRLLDRPHTRQGRTFAAWNVYRVGGGARSGEPLLALKLDLAAGELHVVRGVEAYVHEGYDAGGGVYRTREVRRWVRELTGTIRLAEFASLEALRDELTCRLFHAVVGASRLPLHSVEAPLPAFSFGELFYCYRPDAQAEAAPMRTAAALLDVLCTPALAWLECAKLLETYLHAADAMQTDAAATSFANRWYAIGRTSDDLVSLLRTLFNEVSLSPYTDLVDKTLAFLAAWEAHGALGADHVTDFLAHLLRQTGRHLTAYDLVLFHYRGTNYPDALLLDAVLKAYLARIERDPLPFAAAYGRRRRRALRQAWLLRRRYEGHAVPDAPTSPGENARVMPNQPRVPEEQLLQPAQRRRLLYAADLLLLGNRAAAVLREAVADLQHADELRELGLALYVDRPLGDAKAPAEPDATPLLASEAFSASIAAARLAALTHAGLLTEDERGKLTARLREPEFAEGLSLDKLGAPRRPGTVALTDARLAAGDFVFRRTVPGAVRALRAAFDFSPLSRWDLDWMTAGSVLVTRGPTGRMLLYDSAWQPRLEMTVPAQEYRSRGGVELPANGLLVLRLWTADARAHDFSTDPVPLPARQ